MHFSLIDTQIFEVSFETNWTILKEVASIQNIGFWCDKNCTLQIYIKTRFISFESIEELLNETDSIRESLTTMNLL